MKKKYSDVMQKYKNLSLDNIHIMCLDVHCENVEEFGGGNFIKNRHKNCPSREECIHNI
jgi:hypothetical protein